MSSFRGVTDGGVSGAALDGDEVRRLYEQHGRALLAYACALLRDPSQAEDVLHHVFLRLLQDRVRTISSPRYLFRAVRNRAFNHVRDRSRDVELDETARWLESPSGSTETALALQSALGMLPEEQREVIALRVWGRCQRSEEMRSVIAAVAAACLFTAVPAAQQSTENAALRYWMAFAVLQDAPADAATADLLQRVADGSVPWDEGRLGPILDANATRWRSCGGDRCCDRATGASSTISARMHRSRISHEREYSGASTCWRESGWLLAARCPKRLTKDSPVCAFRSTWPAVEPSSAC